MCDDWVPSTVEWGSILETMSYRLYNTNVKILSTLFKLIPQSRRNKILQICPDGDELSVIRDIINEFRAKKSFEDSQADEIRESLRKHGWITKINGDDRVIFPFVGQRHTHRVDGYSLGQFRKNVYVKLHKRWNTWKCNDGTTPRLIKRIEPLNYKRLCVVMVIMRKKCNISIHHGTSDIARIVGSFLGNVKFDHDWYNVARAIVDMDTPQHENQIQLPGMSRIPNNDGYIYCSLLSFFSYVFLVFLFFLHIH